MSTKIKCPFCGGTGKDPYNLLSKTSQCQVCNGIGTIEIDVPFRKCVFCSGTGKNPLGARVPCIVCKGKGSNSINSEIICEKCNGTGRAVDGLPCTVCKGTGYNERKKI
jgi:DnaJ-class molecular chaperone